MFVCAAGYVYGKELLTLELMKELRERGHEIHCIRTSWSNGEFEKLLNQASIPSTTYPLGFISKQLSWSTVGMTLDQLRKLPSLWLGYRKSLKTYHPEVVVHTNFHHLILLWPILNGTINVFHVHECFPSTRFYKFVFGAIARRLRLFIAVSQFVAASLAELGIPKHKISHVLNGISLDDQSKGRIEKSDQDSPVAIGIIGQVGEWKGHDDLVEALSLLKDEGLEFKCRIFGDGDPVYANELRQRIISHGLFDLVEWSGVVRDRNSIYSLIDLCVVPTRSSEPYGLVAAEASLNSIPVVASNQGGLPEIVIDEQTGYLVDSGSAIQLAQKLRLLIESKPLRDRMGAAGRVHALENLTSARMVRQFEQKLCLLSN
jgi:glycosyltransferase involved in cell wall biosynthesis